MGIRPNGLTPARAATSGGGEVITREDRAGEKSTFWSDVDGEGVDRDAVEDLAVTAQGYDERVDAVPLAADLERLERPDQDGELEIGVGNPVRRHDDAGASVDADEAVGLEADVEDVDDVEVAPA